MTSIQKYQKILFPPLIGLGGFAFNQFAVEIGFGVHFLFGSILVYSLIRLLNPWSICIAVSIASIETVILWQHPWAWLIWTVEALFIGYSYKKISPISADLIFWLSFGVPALLLTYGVFLEFDLSSLVLVVEKQVVNGIFNVVVGEIIFLIFSYFIIKAKGKNNVYVPTSHILTSAVLATFIIPLLIWVRIDAAVQVNSVIRDARTQLEYTAREINAVISSWIETSTENIVVAAEVLLSNQTAAKTIIEKLASVEYIEVFDRDRNVIKTTRENGTGLSYKTPLIDIVIESGQAQISGMVSDGTRNHVDIYHPIQHNDKDLYVHAGAALSELSDRLYSMQKRFSLLDSDGNFLTVCADCRITEIERSAVVEKVRQGTFGKPLIHFEEKFGPSLMSSIKDAKFYGVYKFTDSHPWFILIERPLNELVGDLRSRQGLVLIGVIFLVYLIWLMAWVFSRKFVNDLQLLIAKSTELIEMGHSNESVTQVLLSEFGTIADRLRSAENLIKDERAYARDFQRQLDVITKYAPIVLYKIEIEDSRKGKLLSVTESISRLLGYPIAAIYRKGCWSNRIHSDDYKRVSRVFSGLSAGAHRSQDYRLLREDGQFIWVLETLVVPQPSGVNEPLHGFGILLDISDKKFAEMKLSQASRMISLGEMAAGMAHELNQPLNLIRLAVANLENSLGAVEGITSRDLRRIDRIKSSVTRASKLVTHMRLFGKANSSEHRIFGIDDAISRSLELVKSDLSVSKIEVVYTKSDEDLFTSGRSDMIEQVFVNLFLNARDALIKSRDLDVYMKPTIQIDIHGNAGEVVIGIRDNGGGIKESILPHIFEPFVSTKDDVHGTGLGLSVSFGIIKDHGGSIVAENACGGAVFTIVLPRVNKIYNDDE